MPTASWDHLERTIERLHAAAREPLGPREFYRQVIHEVAAALDAAGAAAWRAGPAGRPELIVQQAPDSGVEPDWSARLAAVERQLSARGASAFDSDAEHDAILCPVPQPAGDASAPPVAVLELLMPRGASPAVRQGWLDFAAAVADVAADFHARDELRRLRGASALRGQAVELIRRVGAAPSLVAAAFEAANEGRRVLECDRVSVLARRGSRLRLLATSGVDAVKPRVEFTRRCERLADEIAAWGEPIEQPAADGGEHELPPRLAAALEEYLDESHARTMAAVPLRFPLPAEGEGAPAERYDAVLIAERFAAGPALRDAVTELGELSAPALGRAARLDRFPVGLAMRWSERLARLRSPRRLAKTLAFAGVAAAAMAALALWPADFTVEAPARFAAALEREVFATTSGAVAEVRVTHGQTVAAGDVLVVLDDPELELKLQEVRGEIATARQRLEALAVTRTDRTLREEPAGDRLPLAAEQLQLEERLAGLARQEQLLAARREALTLRSPCAGDVLTRDVQSLLESRPVERGQSLLTIADAASGWELRADVSQRNIGHVIEARAASRAPLAVDYRLMSDVQTSYPGHVIGVEAAAPLDAEGLRDEPAPVEVRIAADGPPPPAARPGMSATVRIDCGRRSLGYVWLHDVAATLYRWATF
jgi:multidrug efflux pump subunit AcrA (membrane-fusion protein)